MRPAFSSTGSAAAFALLLLMLLALPLVLGKNLLPSREQSYAALSWGSGPYPWIQNQIFEETNDIDIAFVGSSHIFNAINTPYVQAKLSEQLGRPAVVRTIAWGGAGYDALYFIMQDLLAHRRVRLLVFYDENGSLRNTQLPMLFRFADNAAVLPGLSAAEKGLFYFAAVVGMPRNLLELLRPNLPAPLVADKPNHWEIVADGPNPAANLGCLSFRHGFAADPLAAAAPFEMFAPETSARPTDALIYSADTKTNFEFSTAPLPAWQAHFARKFGVLLREHGVQPVMLYLPALAEIRAPAIGERTFWPEIFPDNFALLGIPPAKLFGDLTDADVIKLYADPVHFNQNGQQYFTRLITPTLINLYETQFNH
jgi:hypothetical protein